MKDKKIERKQEGNNKTKQANKQEIKRKEVFINGPPHLEGKERPKKVRLLQISKRLF